MKPRPTRILLIDDDPDDLDLVRIHLAREFPDLEVRQVDDLEGFERALAGPPPDVVVTDYHLGFADGLDLTRRLHDKDPDLPVILFTGTGNEEVAARAVTGGVDDYVIKSPRHLARLANSVGRSLDLANEKRWRREAEHQLDDFRHQFAQAQKLEALGAFAGGIAHDFNNLLTIVRGHLEILGVELGERVKSSDSFREIDRAVESAAGLTRQLLAFSRRQHLKNETLDLSETTARTVRMLARVLGESVSVHFEAADEPLPVDADESQLEQVIVNLAKNARDAMPAGGDLLLRTLVERRATTAGDSREPWACLSVADTGVGMTPEVVERIFDPFFSTKKPGEGTGLGLSTAFGFVSQCGGRLEVESEPGGGTTFRVLLPLADPMPAGVTEPGAEVVPREAGNRGSKRTILVVEDQRALRDLIARTLRKEGYEILSADSGAEALALLDGNRNGIDLLLTDVVMPEMSGPQLLEHLRRDGQQPPKALFMSGYSGGAEARYSGLDPEMPFLAKPFTPAELLRRIEETLG